MQEAKAAGDRGAYGRIVGLVIGEWELLRQLYERMAPRLSSVRGSARARGGAHNERAPLKRLKRRQSLPSCRIPPVPGVLLALVLGSAGCAARAATDHRLMTDAWRAAVADTIRAVVALSQAAHESDDCEGGDNSWMPDDGHVHYVALDRVIRLESRDEILALCQRLKRDRVSQREQIEEQTVHLLTPDAAYVVTRSVGTTQWRDGRTQVLPTVETAVMARQGDRWRVVYKHISWREPASEQQ